MTGLRWTRGDTALQREIERQLASGEAECLHDNVRRALLRVRSAHGDVVVTQFRVGSGRHPLRERVKERLGRAPAERRALGVPVASWVVLEDVRPAIAASFALEQAAADAERVLDSLPHFVIALHRAGVDHGDLKGTHLLLQRSTTELAVRVIDLEGVRFPRRLRDAQRLRALAELNASLPDAYPAHLRRRAFRALRRGAPASRELAGFDATRRSRQSRASSPLDGSGLRRSRATLGGG